ncbi:MAG TPA: CopG family transcriptional regulator [Acidimicrobiia bacterium]
MPLPTSVPSSGSEIVCTSGIHPERLPRNPLPIGNCTDETLERALDELVKEEGLSRQEIIRWAILDRCERAGPRQEGCRQHRSHGGAVG